MAEVIEYVEIDDEFDGEREHECMTCCGEGWEFCEDWDCWEPDCDGETHTCPNCRGSGLAKDQWYW